MSQTQQQMPFDSSIDAYNLLALQHEAEIAREQIKSLQQEVLEKEQLVQQLEQDLHDINNDLLAMNAELMMRFCSQPLPIDAAKEIAKTILASKQSIGESIAQMLSAIYGSKIEAWELQQTPMSVLKSSPWTTFEQFFPEHKSLQSQIEELKNRMMMLRTQMTQLKTTSVQLKDITKSG